MCRPNPVEGFAQVTPALLLLCRFRAKAELLEKYENFGLKMAQAEAEIWS